MTSVSKRETSSPRMRTTDPAQHRARWLRALLQHGPRHSKEIFRLGARLGFSEYALRRTARGIRAEVTWWSLPPHKGKRAPAAGGAALRVLNPRQSFSQRADWIRATLVHGPQLSTAVYELGMRDGHHERILRRVAVGMGVVITRVKGHGRGSVTMWSLPAPGQETPQIRCATCGQLRPASAMESFGIARNSEPECKRCNRTRQRRAQGQVPRAQFAKAFDQRWRNAEQREAQRAWRSAEGNTRGAKAGIRR